MTDNRRYHKAEMICEAVGWDMENPTRYVFAKWDDAAQNIALVNFHQRRIGKRGIIFSDLTTEEGHAQLIKRLKFRRELADLHPEPIYQRWLGYPQGFIKTFTDRGDQTPVIADSKGEAVVMNHPGFPRFRYSEVTENQYNYGTLILARLNEIYDDQFPDHFYTVKRMIESLKLYYRIITSPNKMTEVTMKATSRRTGLLVYPLPELTIDEFVFGYPHYARFEEQSRTLVSVHPLRFVQGYLTKTEVSRDYKFNRGVITTIAPEILEGTTEEIAPSNRVNFSRSPSIKNEYGISERSYNLAMTRTTGTWANFNTPAVKEASGTSDGQLDKPGPIISTSVKPEDVGQAMTLQSSGKSRGDRSLGSRKSRSRVTGGGVIKTRAKTKATAGEIRRIWVKCVVAGKFDQGLEYFSIGAERAATDFGTTVEEYGHQFMNLTSINSATEGYRWNDAMNIDTDFNMDMPSLTQDRTAVSEREAMASQGPSHNQSQVNSNYQGEASFESGLYGGYGWGSLHNSNSFGLPSTLQARGHAAQDTQNSRSPNPFASELLDHSTDIAPPIENPFAVKQEEGTAPSSINFSYDNALMLDQQYSNKFQSFIEEVQKSILSKNEIDNVVREISKLESMDDKSTAYHNAKKLYDLFCNKIALIISSSSNTPN